MGALSTVVPIAHSAWPLPAHAGEDESTVPGLARSVLAGFKPFLQVGDWGQWVVEAGRSQRRRLYHPAPCGRRGPFRVRAA